MPITRPVPGAITSPFGAPRDGHTHQGVDLSALQGTPIIAAASGSVFKAGQISNNAGLGVEIAHADGWVTKYFHMSSVLADVGQSVGPGEVIGLVGATGDAKGPHLHFEIWHNGVPLDPADFLAGSADISSPSQPLTDGQTPIDYQSYADDALSIDGGLGNGGAVVIVVGVVLLAFLVLEW